MSVLAIIPARSGSKGFKNKNLAKIGKKTLLEIAIQLAIDSNDIEDVYVSTDSEDYAKIALKAGALVPKLRSKHLSGDTIKTIDVVIDLINYINKPYKYLILLQPTAPVRQNKHLEEIMQLLKKNDVNAVVSAEKLEEPHPEKVKKINNDGFVIPYIQGTSSEIPRQQLPSAYKLNGAIYAIRTNSLIKEKTFLPSSTLAYIMPKGVNIDSEVDYIILKSLLKLDKVIIHGINNNKKI